ncbi:dipeptidase [Nitritalea halalkaliphila]|nr:membrane dipeptidase [Nitritalea halalkaliphila]
MLSSFPIVDTHCDLLSYLAVVPQADPMKADAIACALPHLQAGGVHLQVFAIYTDVRPGSMALADRQVAAYQHLLSAYADRVHAMEAGKLQDLSAHPGIGALAAIENAAGLAEENTPLPQALQRLKAIHHAVGGLAYISLTHHTENRFGGGNYTEGVGLKADGQKLLDAMAELHIPIDLSHTSDLLAEGILQHIEKAGLTLPVLASHSNFRAVWPHARNISDEFAQEVVQRGGVIGINFLRAFLDTENPERIFAHIVHGMERFGPEALCFGADYFYTKNFPDPSRHPFYFPNVENASCYPSLLEKLAQYLPSAYLPKLAYQNAAAFFQRQRQVVEAGLLRG